MAAPDALIVGHTPWSLTVPPDRRVELRSAPPAPTASPADLTREALEHPHGFEAMRRALTPDDRVTVVLDPSLPAVGPVLTEVLAHLVSGGIHLDAVTVLTAPGAPDDWVEALPDELTDVRAEVHDPADRQKLAYLATTKAGRRLYLNRTLVDADFVVVVSGRGYDPLTGYAGAEAAVFPVLSDEETRAEFAGPASTDAPGAEPWPARAEAAEVFRLLGMPFLVQVIAGAADTIEAVVAGLPDAAAEGVRRQDARWRGTVDGEADTVVAAVSGDPARHTFLELAKAAACAARVVRPGGRIAVLSAAAPDLGDGARLLRTLDGPTGARKLLAKEKPADWAACLLWLYAARKHSLYLASGYPDDVAEELFATPIRTASEVQRLIDGGGRVLLVPDAHRMMVTVG
jgi:nickel-dependent lactate racemase